MISAVISSSASLADTYRTAPESGGGFWSSLSSWEVQNSDGEWEKAGAGQGVPGPGDDVTIRDHTITVDQNVTIESLTIRQDGLLKYDQAEVDRTLTVTGPDGLTIDAVTSGTDPGILEVTEGFALRRFRRMLKLTGGSSETGAFDINGVLRITGPKTHLDIPVDTKLGGVGEVVLQDDEASIRIDADRTLTIGSSLVVSGWGRVIRLSGTSDAILENLGTVVSNAGGTLELTVNVLLKDDDDADWISRNARSVLLFAKGHTDPCLAGDFTVADGATLNLHARINTTGDFTCSNGGSVNGLYYNCDCGSVPPSCTQAVGCDP